MITVHNKNIGITLFKWGKWKLELWILREGLIHAHEHTEFDSLICHVFGKALFGRGMDIKEKNRLTWPKWHSIKINQIHNAYIKDKFCVILNLQRWTIKPTSAARNFILVK